MCVNVEHVARGLGIKAIYILNLSIHMLPITALSTNSFLNGKRLFEMLHNKIVKDTVKGKGVTLCYIPDL